MEMSDGETRSLLDLKSHGVLSMGAESRGYGIPLAYSYDEENDRIILGFVNAPESKKQQFATATEEVTLTVYDYKDIDSWESVIVTGTLHRVTDADFPGRLTPLFFLHEDEDTGERRMVDLDEYDREWYELRIDDISGRYSGWES